MTIDESIEARRAMLARWYLSAVDRHDRMLRSTRTRNAVYIGGKPYFVTGEQLHGALDATYNELHDAFSRRPGWGVGEHGEPLYCAVVGLAQRRLRARLIDEIRRGERVPVPVDLEVVTADDAGLVALVADPHDEFTADLFAELARESMSTQAVVILAGAGFSAPEIAARTGLKPAAARQRLSRFGRRVRSLQEAA